MHGQRKHQISVFCTIYLHMVNVRFNFHITALDNSTALTQSSLAQNLQMGNDTSGGTLGSFAVSGHGNFFSSQKTERCQLR